MRRAACCALLGLLFCVPYVNAQSSDHVEVGVFADYMNLTRTAPHINFVGVGGRAGFNVSSQVQIEAEMGYDFERNFTSTFSDGITTQFRLTLGQSFVSSRPLRHGLIGSAMPH